MINHHNLPTLLHKFILSLIGLGALIWLTWPHDTLIVAQASYTGTPTATIATIDIVTATNGATGTPTPVPTSPAGWRSSASVRIPIRLQRTVQAAVGGVGGGPGSSPCDSLPIFGNDFNFWMISPLFVKLVIYPVGISLSESELWSEFGIESTSLLKIADCGNDYDPTTQLTLYWPDGHTTPPTGEFSTICPSNFFYCFQFSEENPEGSYRLEIRNRHDTISGEIQFSKRNYLTDIYSGPRFVLRDPTTSQERWEYVPVQSIQIDYSKYAPSEFVEVGLYRFIPKEVGNPVYSLISSWVFQADSNGNYRDILSIPIDTCSGDYVVAASAIEPKPYGSFNLDSITFGFGTINEFYSLHFSLTSPQGPKCPDVVVWDYYSSINTGIFLRGNFEKAYAYLSHNFQAQQSYQNFVYSFATIGSVEIEDVRLVRQDASSATVEVTIVTLYEASGQEKHVRYEITWQLILENDNWRLDSAQVHTLKGSDTEVSAGTSPTILDPVKVTMAFYETLNTGATTRDFYAAYNYLSISRKASRSYEELKAIYANTRQVQVESIEQLEENETTAVIHVIVRLTELIGGALQETRYDVIYQLVKEEGEWRLDKFKSTKL